MRTLSLREICDRVAACQPGADQDNPAPAANTSKKAPLQNLRDPFGRSHKLSIHDCHGVTGFYKGSKDLGYVEYAPGPNRTQDKESLRLRFLSDGNGNIKKPVFINYASERLAAEALATLRQTATRNRHSNMPEPDQTKERAQLRNVRNTAPVTVEKQLKRDRHHQGLITFLR